MYCFWCWWSQLFWWPCATVPLAVRRPLCLSTSCCSQNPLPLCPVLSADPSVNVCEGPDPGDGSCTPSCAADLQSASTCACKDPPQRVYLDDLHELGCSVLYPGVPRV